MTLRSDVAEECYDCILHASRQNFSLQTQVALSELRPTEFLLLLHLIDC